MEKSLEQFLLGWWNPTPLPSPGQIQVSSLEGLFQHDPERLREYASQLRAVAEMIEEYELDSSNPNASLRIRGNTARDRSDQGFSSLAVEDSQDISDAADTFESLADNLERLL